MTNGGRARCYSGLPPKRTRGLRIGLFGGSFNPPHEGHRLASLVALRKLKLDRVWWLVSPGNPLKDVRVLAPFDQRLETARVMADHPAVDVSGVEARWRLRYTADVLLALKRRCPAVHFVWIMGADNLRGFHRWHRWTTIAKAVPIAVVDRPGDTLRSLGGSAASFMRQWRQPESQAARFALRPPPAFIFLHGPRSAQSSTKLRSRPFNRGDRDDRQGS